MRGPTVTRAVKAAGMVFVKPLRQAVRDGEPVYAVVRASVTNQDGNTSSMTVPGIGSQVEMIRNACRDAGIEPGSISYVEAHGTGTPVGDPIEAMAIGQAVGVGRSADQRCLIGSVKTNIGHLEAASGVAGIIKTSLALQQKTVPPNRDFQSPNPNIPLDDLGACSGEPANPTAVERGGTNDRSGEFVWLWRRQRTMSFSRRRPAHGTKPPAGERAHRPYVLTVSARSEDALYANVAAYRRALADETSDLADFCYSAGARKEQHGERLVVIGDSREQLRKRLRLWLLKEQVRGVVVGRTFGSPGGITFAFTGQGTQWWAMGNELFAAEPVFRKEIERIDALLQPLGRMLSHRGNGPGRGRHANGQNGGRPTRDIRPTGRSRRPLEIVGHRTGPGSSDTASAKSPPLTWPGPTVWKMPSR